MTHAVIYTRFSPRRNAEEAVSCETQEALCRELLTAKGWTERSAHRDEAVSGDTELDERQGLMAAIEALQKGDVLLVYRRDRLARDAFLAEFLRRKVGSKGARIEACQGEAVASGDESPEARFVRGVLDLVAQLERELISARTKASMLAQQRAGRRVSKQPPYGKQPDPDDPKRWIDNPGELAAISRAKALKVQGLSPYQIARALDLELPLLARSKRWSPRTVEKILAR